MFVIFAINHRNDELDYLGLNDDSKMINKLPVGVRGLLKYFSFTILIHSLIPISLYVSIEIVKFIQVWFINRDELMYDPISDTRVNSRTSNLNESLG